MFLLGILSVIQITFIPGVIFNKFYKFTGGFFYCLSSIFATSLVINFFLVYILALLGIYTKTVFLLFFIAEIIALVILYRHTFKLSFDQFSGSIQAKSGTLVENVKEWLTTPFPNSTLLLLRQIFQVIIFSLAFSLLLWFFRRLINGIGTVFNTWDAVLAYNTWAQTWAQNQVTSHSLYPQLLSANLSLTYLFMGNTEVVLFAKAIMPLFCVLLVFTLFEQGIQQRKTGFFIAIILAYLLIKKFTGDIFTDGYADIPVMFMVFMTLNQIFRQEEGAFNKHEFVLGTIFALGAGLTKQVGLYCFAICPIVYLFLTQKNNWKWILIVTSIALVFLLTWYTPLIIKSLNNFGFTSLPGLAAIATNTYQGVPWWQRMGLAFLSLGKYLFLYVLTIPFLFVLDKKYRLLIVFFIIPFSIFWSIVASYDVRNLAITFPIVAIVVGLGFERILDISFSLFSKSRLGNLPAISVVILLVSAIIGLSFLFPEERIIAKQREEQKKIFSPEINVQLYMLPFGENGCEKIMTNYPVMYLPGLENYQINTYFSDFGDYQTMIKDESTCWMLVPNYAIDLVSRDIENKLISGEYKFIWNTHEWVDYQLIKIR